MEDMAAFYYKMVALSKQTASMTDKTAAVKAFIECNCDDSLPALPSRPVVPERSGARQLASRTDARSLPYLVAHGAPAAPATSRSGARSSIFADRAYHVDAAATLAGHAATQSGFGDSMPEDYEESKARFEAYLGEFARAPHWLYKGGGTTEVEHSTTNHQQFTRDLAAVVTEQLNFINAGQDAIDAAVGNVTALAQLVSNSTEGRATSTLYSTIGISREPADTGPLNYGIFYMALDMNHVSQGKSQVLTTKASTFALLYGLDSPVLEQNADLYDRLTRTAVEDWFNNLGIY